MAETGTVLAEQFDDLEQQHEASHLGMWTFLATEIMFFGVLFTGYIIYRHAYPQGFALGSRHTEALLGTINTAVLLTSSLTMALAVHALQQNRHKQAVRYLLITLLFGAAFLGVKGFEYSREIKEHLLPGKSFSLPGQPGAQMFFYFYWVLTGLHALHVLAGVGMLALLAFFASRLRFSARYYTPVELGGLYWHFVDIVWVFLYPLIYLINRHP